MLRPIAVSRWPSAEVSFLERQENEIGHRLSADGYRPDKRQEGTSSMMNETVSPALSRNGRYVILVCAFLGWFCAGFHLAISALAMQPAAIDLLGRVKELDVPRYQQLLKLAPKKATDSSALSPEEKVEWTTAKAKVVRWYGFLQCGFLFGAASGGLFFGRLGDRIGRSKAMALSILTYSIMSGAASLAQSPLQLLVLWYLTCTGVGGMWPNGVALVSEAWASLSRPAAAGIIGTSANIGIFLVSTVARNISAIGEWPMWQWISFSNWPETWHLGADVSFATWRWMFVVGAVPVVLGVFALLGVPESPRWLSARRVPADGPSSNASTWEVFRPPLLRITIVGIALATIPLIGGWGSANWMVPWAGEVGDAATPPMGKELRADVQQARSLTGIVGSLIGGWVGSVVGRRRTYLLASVLCLVSAQCTFWFVVPTDRWMFLLGVGSLGFFSGIFFGWLPLFLPELFSTRIRSTGAGVSFNFGRILTAFTLFATSMLTESELFQGDYARIGRVTSLIFALGALAVWFAPDTSQKQLAD